MKFLDCFPGTSADQNTWDFQLEKKYNGAFGGINGGVFSAISVHVARHVSEGRQPIGLDSRYLRGFRPGEAKVECTVLNAGRTLTTVNVDIINSDQKLCTRSVVMLVNQEALAPLNIEGNVGCIETHKAYKEGRTWPQPSGYVVPLIDTFQPRILAKDEHGILTATQVIWDEPGTCAEAACIAADISVGPPVGSVVAGKASTPNPDLSLRFCQDTELPGHLMASCRMESMINGLASTRIEVRAEKEIVAVGVSTTTCITMKVRP